MAPLSLRTIHMVFILLVIVGADLFGAWAIWHHARNDAPLILSLGILVALGGIGLIIYVLRLVRKLDAARIL